MNILITQGKSSLAAALAGHLSASNMVRLTDMVSGDADAGIFQCDLGHDSATDDVVRDIDAIIHIGYNAVGSGDPSELLDYHTRGTYNLLTAAAAAGVSRCIYLSTLRLLEDYEENLTVTEKWRSLPPVGRPAFAGLPSRRDRVQGVRPRRPDRCRHVCASGSRSYAETARRPSIPASPPPSRSTTYSRRWRDRSPRMSHAGRTFTFNRRCRGNGTSCTPPVNYCNTHPQAERR